MFPAVSIIESKISDAEKVIQSFAQDFRTVCYNYDVVLIVFDKFGLLCLSYSSHCN